MGPRFLICAAISAAVLACSVPGTRAQDAPAGPAGVSNNPDPQRVSLKVERQEKDSWRLMDAATVFKNGDKVRFRVSTNFSGYLYVMNHGTSGAYELLFPRADTGSDNRVEAGKEYLVPSLPGGFKVAGPAGYDTVYMLVSPVAMTRESGPQATPPASAQVPSTLRPRCDDTIFRARGECLDGSAGVKPVAPGEKLPENLNGVAGPTPRDLLFIQDQGGVVMSSQQALAGPVLYELRLAHR
jgi:hypothetical protein